MEKQTNIINQESPNVHSENIKEEFYKWFENRGLLSDLRAYMRQLMVKALEESKKNGKTIRQRKASSSPKMQAVNLLVVDYLFHEDYLYTVSVFASEAQILDSLPQYSQYVTQTVREQRRDPSSLPRFSQLETEDILDTLRLPPTHRERQEATQAYLSGQESLLTCVVRTLSSSYNQSLVEENFRPSVPEDTVEEPLECSHQLWSQEMENLLLLAGVKLAHIRRMQKKWAQTIEEEKQKSKKEVKEELSAQQAEWQQEMEQRLRTEALEQMQVEQQLLRERQSRVELRERGLASLAEQLTAVHDDINQRWSQLSLQSEELRMREARQQSDKLQLEQRLSQLQIREEHLQLTYANFREQSVNIHTSEDKDHPLEESIDSNHDKTDTESQNVPKVLNEEVALVSVYTQTDEPVVVAFTQTTDTTDHEQQTSQDNDIDPHLVLQLHLDREKINELQEENLELRAHALQQRHRIDELTNRAASLTSQLEESQVAVSVLSGRDSAVVVVPPPPALPAQNLPAFAIPTFGFNTPQRIGAGEESLFAFRHQQATPRPDSRRRPLRFAFSQNPNPTSEESSPTDEVIQNARSRIQQLEQESTAVQRNFQEFQNRILTSDSVMFPPLDASRIRNPVWRVRRSDIVPYVRFPNPPYPPWGTLNNPLSQPTRPRGENDEDSSSDLAGFYDVEGVTNSRRIFTQRNLRQFERWKQFKKKFQRRDVFDQNRRNIVANSNTSSDDDEKDVKSNRRRYELNRQRKSNDTNVSTQKHKTTDSKDKNEASEKNQNTSLGNHSKNDASRGNSQPEKEPVLVGNIEKGSKLNTGSHSKPKRDEESFSVEQNRLTLEVERTEKLIESVKVLLGEQINNQGSTLSNESLPLESLPKDSQSGSRNKIYKTDNSSVLTVQNINSPAQNRSKTLVPENTLETTVNTSLTETKPDKHQSITIRNVMSDEPIKDSNYIPEERYDLQENTPEPLTIPTLRLVSPGLNVENEDFLVTDGVHSIDAAELENDDRATTSVTSGSDILRELNSCKTESNNSIISGGWAEDSKHSSDFWN